MAEHSQSTAHRPIVLVAVDAAGDAARALDVATRMATRLGGRLDIAHVVERIPRGREALDLPLTREELLAEGAGVLRRAADQARETFHGIIRGHLTSGPVAEELVALATQQRADFLVVGTHGRSGLSRTLVGSVAEKIVRHASCPVVVVARHPSAPLTRAPARSIEIALEDARNRG